MSMVGHHATAIQFLHQIGMLQLKYLEKMVIMYFYGYHISNFKMRK